MKKICFILIILFVICHQKAFSTDAPITTAGTVTTSATTAIVPITVLNFTYIGSCMLEIHYDPAIATATTVTMGPSMTGGLDLNLTTPGVIILGWYTYPAITLPDNTVIFNINFSKVTSGTTAITWYDDGFSCYYSDGDYNILNDVPTSSFYIPGSLTFTGSLNADFIASTTTPPKNTTVTFTDNSTGGPTSWDWSFNRPTIVYMNGTSSTSQNPQVQFTDGGLYTVTLVVHNAGGSDTEVKPDYIRAGTPGLWTGTSSSAWNTTTNWDDWLIPVAATDVVIPATAPFWPIYNGSFILGSTCKSFTMYGSSQAVINGNFTINAGSTLMVTENGILFVNGNWTNAGIFNAGTGTVNFTGSSPASLISGGSPTVINYFYNLTISKVGATLTIPSDMTLNVNGNILINP